MASGTEYQSAMRVDARDLPWPWRPWLMAAICAVAGILFQHLVSLRADPTPGEAALATFIAVATISFVLTVEWRRWWWALLFAVLWGVVTGLVGYSTQSYNRVSTIFEWPFLSGIFAVMLAAPLFQTARDDWHAGDIAPLDPVRAHTHAWTDAVIGAAALAFIGVTFALAWLIAGLFDIIGIGFIRTLLGQAWFAWGLAGFAFGAGVGILRERDALVATMQRLVMLVFGVLAPVLAFALVTFLLSLLVTGLSGLWDSWVSAAALSLASGAGAYLLLNAALGAAGEDRAVNPILRWSALLLALTVLPLAVLAFTALTLRVNEYGWTPARLWGVVSTVVALAFGVGGWWAVAKGRLNFAGPIRSVQIWLAAGICLLALLLALPIFDFGAISTRDQVARLESGRVKPADFDWGAMAFEFGPSGRRALARIAESGSADARPLARGALAATSRYSFDFAQRTGQDARPLQERVRVLPADRPLPAQALENLRGMPVCWVGACTVQWLSADRFAVIGQPQGARDRVQVEYIRHRDDGEWAFDEVDDSAALSRSIDLSAARVEVREVRRRQLFIDGQPVGKVVE